MFLYLVYCLQVPASQENVVVVESARSDNSKHAHQDILSLVDNQVNESLKRLLPQMLIKPKNRSPLTKVWRSARHPF